MADVTATFEPTSIEPFVQQMNLAAKALASVTKTFAELATDWEMFCVDLEVDHDLANVMDEEPQAVLQQFIKDGGTPWDIYAVETAFLGAPLEQLI